MNHASSPPHERGRRELLITGALWLLLCLFCLWLYWDGICAWFQRDDFAWLYIHRDVGNWRDLVNVLFKPMAQGTLRWLSERAFFLSFYSLFGMRALPYHLWVYATQCANLGLLIVLMRQMGAGRLAAVMAPLFWLTQIGLVVPMGWASAYNEILCSFFLLLASVLWFRYMRTGSTRWYAAVWAVFLLGFGALELNIIFPALAAVYSLARSRRYVWRTVPLWAVSLAYYALHHAITGGNRTETYRMYFDAELFRTFAVYWRWLLNFHQLASFGTISPATATKLTVVLTLGIVAATGWLLRRGKLVVWIGLAWLFFPLLPLLPLKNHITDYYLTMPAIGFAMLASLSLAAAARHRLLVAVAALLAVVYLGAGAEVVRRSSQWHARRAAKVRSLVQGVARAHQLHPGKIILLHGVDSELFDVGVYDHPFYALGIMDVYLTPESLATVQPDASLRYRFESYFLPPAVAREVALSGQAVVYQVEQRGLRAITTRYREEWEAKPLPPPPALVQVGLSWFGRYLGQGWYDPEITHRWMGQSASLTIGGARQNGARLAVEGIVPAQLVRNGPLSLQVMVENELAGTFALTGPNQPFRVEAPLPAGLTGREFLRVQLVAERTMRVDPDTRDLSLAISSVAVKETDKIPGTGS